MAERTWKRGRKKASPEKQSEYLAWARERTRIANLVARHKEIEKKCCICGKDGNILHNKKDPYYITFICDECRKDPNNLILAEERRFDVKKQLKGTHTKNVADEQIVRIVVGYMNEMKYIGDYCDDIGITRHQFESYLNRYDKLFPKQNIKDQVKNRSNAITKQEMLKYQENQRLIEK